MKYFSLLVFPLLCVSCKMLRDTAGYDIKSKRNSDNIIFTTHSEFLYSIDRIKDNDTLDSFIVNHLNDTLTVEYIKLTVLPGSFFGQTKIKWEYLDRNDSVIQKSITGIIEDSTTVWIHPPRSGRPLIFTESAPFHEVKFPIANNPSWNGGISNIKGYEEIGLEGKVSFSYRSMGLSEIKTLNKHYQKTWKFTSEGQSIIGKSTHTFYFDENDGFVYSEYDFPNSEKLIIQLEERVGSASTNQHEE